MKRFVSAGIAVAAGAAALGLTLVQFGSEAQATGNDRNPRFAVDAAWPKKLPNRWLVGQVAGVAVDRHDHIWIIQRPGSLTNDEAGAEPRFPLDPAVPAERTGPRSNCCLAAPSVLVFDRAGNLLRAWGGPADPGFMTNKCTPAMGCNWPTNEHGIFVDHNDYVYIGGNGGANHQVLKFSRNGTFIYQIGQPGAFTGGRSNDTNGGPGGRPLLGQPADMEVDPDTNELYIADGYQNKRVLVVDAATGLYKRHWGAYGQNPVDDTAPAPYEPGVVDQNFRNPVHCVRIANDGKVYVCDRVNNRFQVFKKNGEFLDEVLYAREIARQRCDLGYRSFARPAPASPLQRRRREPEHRDLRSAQRVRGREVRPQRPQRGPVPLGAQPGSRFEGQHLHGRGRHRQAGPEVQAGRLSRPERQHTTMAGGPAGSPAFFVSGAFRCADFS